MVGTTELILLSGLALLLFGGKKLPEMMRGLGQGVKEFKKGMKDVVDDSKREKDSPKSDTSNEKIEKEIADGKENPQIDDNAEQ